MIIGMGHDPTERTTPDLFPPDAVQDASVPPKLPAAEMTTEAAKERYILPKDLPAAVKHLSDGELDLMHAVTLDEMKRRGRMPRGVETDLRTLRNRFDDRPNLMKSKSPQINKRRYVEVAEVSLTRGQLNAVRAVFKAGITPSRIARQFGISQSNVQRALASNEPKRWTI
jgi:predicted DNA-binding protein (UPF0251 family)